MAGDAEMIDTPTATNVLSDQTQMNQFVGGPVGSDAPNGALPNTDEYHKFDPRPDLPDFASYPLLRTIPVSNHSCAAVKFKRDGTQLATGSGVPASEIDKEDPVKIWDVETGKQVMSFKGHTVGASDVCWSYDMRLLASASDDTTVRIWDVNSGKCIHTLEGHTHDVTSCSFNVAGNMLASGSMDETIRLWDVQNGKCIRVTPGHSDPVTYVDFFSVEHQHPLLVSASLDGISRIWSPIIGSCMRSLINSSNLPLSFSIFTPNTKFVLLGMLGGRMELWDYKDRVRKKVYKGHANKYFCLKAAFLLNDPAPEADEIKGGYVVCGSEDHHVYVWHLNRPEKFGPQLLRGKANAAAPGDGHHSVVLSVDTSPAQPMIASAGAEPDGTVKLWRSNLWKGT